MTVSVVIVIVEQTGQDTGWMPREVIRYSSERVVPQCAQSMQVTGDHQNGHGRHNMSPRPQK